ncbi:MAG: DNA repair protein RecN [Deltaproteobacteria bacterium]|nr:DNA repair protein RecN [Deltaproteobacteria bacterium]MBW2070412.1 DNA repair protein RecN [Deltaproteobacteria bacterium]
MLAELHIRNFAIIDELTASFDPGLTVITGETGAGKSILVNAINLVLGSRGSAELIRSGSQEATVAALFSRDPQGSAELLVKRTLASSGRNRVYINGEPATVQIMAQLCRGLVSISGQHEHQLFLDPAVQLQILDHYGELTAQREKYSGSFAAVQELNSEIKRLRRRARERQEKQELHRFQLDEIEKAQVKVDEEVKLEEERKLLRHAEELRQGAAEIHRILYADHAAVVGQLSLCDKLLTELSRLDSNMQSLAKMVEDSRFQLEEVAFSMRDYAERVSADPERLQWVEERLHTIKGLLRKYGGDSRALLATAERLREELETVASDEAEIDAKEKQLELAKKRALSEAVDLSRARRQVSHKLEQAVAESLACLDLPGCTVRVAFDQDRELAGQGIKVDAYLLDSSGIDRVAFLFSANPGEELRPLARVASGGELSRVVLALKELQAREGSQETLIFDEVDAGIGGRTAELVGRRLKALSKSYQVICITHLPQIAAYGDHHYVVRKEARQGRTTTSIARVTNEERLAEIARMLGGVKVSEKTRAHAREMLEQARRAHT